MCDMCDTCDMQPHCWQPCWQEIKSFVLLDVNPRPSADPEAIRLWTCLLPCPHGQGPHKPPTEPTPAAQPGDTCTTAAASKGAAGEGKSKGKYHLSGEQSIVTQDNLSRVQFTPEFAPWSKGKFTFKHKDLKNIPPARHTASHSRSASLSSSFSDPRSSTCFWL